MTKRLWKYIVAGILVACVCGISFMALYSPTISLKAGDIFFGRVAYLYNPDIAQFFYTRAIQTDFPPPYAYYQLSRTYFIQGDFGTAERFAKQELIRFPEHFRSYYILGLTLGYMDREIEAIEAFGKFLEYKPDSWAARNDKAWLHFRVGDIDGAIETIIPAAQENPYNPWVMNTIGVLFMNQGHYVEAVNALTQAKKNADSMDEESWGRAYPGNSPEIYGEGLAAMRISISDNLMKAKQKLDVETGDN